MTDKINPGNQEDKINLENQKISNHVRKKLGFGSGDSKVSRGDVADKSKKEIAKLAVNKIDRERFKGETAQKELFNTINQKSFLSNGTRTIENYRDSIINRTMTEKEYNKIMQQIAENNSILPVSHRRDWNFSGGYGDVILSSTTGKMYCVEDSDSLAELLEDYNGKQYYSSRSGMSGKGYIFTGKKSLIYLPTTRKDIRYPEEDYNYRNNVNGLNITAWSDRGVVDKDYPVTIKYPENNEYSYAFIDPNETNEIIDIIKSGGELSPESYVMRENDIGNIVYKDGKVRPLLVKYLSKDSLEYSKLIDILKWTGLFANMENDLESTGSEFDRVIGIYKYGENFVKKGPLGFATKSYGKQNPRYSVDNKEEIEYTVLKNGKIQKEYVDYRERTKKLKIRGWEFLSNRCTYRVDHESEDAKKYKVMVEYDFEDLGLSKGSKYLFDYFQRGHVGGNDTHYGYSNELGHEVSTIIPNGITYVVSGKNIVFTADGISEEDIGKVEQICLNNTKNIAAKPYKENLHIAFRETKRKAIDGSEDYKEGWLSHGDLLYTHFGDKVFLGYLSKYGDLNPKFTKFLSDEDYEDYEEVISQDELKEKGINYRASYMRNKTYDKALKSYMNHIRWDTQTQIKEAKNYLQTHEDQQFFITDSTDVGNCIPGTESFMSRYNISEGVSSKELLKHPKFEEMIERSNFRNIILKKVVKSIVD